MQIIGQTQSQPKMQMFVSHRDIVVRSSKCGQAIRFIAGVGTQVPRIMHDEVLEKGILPVDAAGKTVDPVQVATLVPEKPKLITAPEDAMDREDAIKGVLKALVDDNSPKNFTGAGCPTAKAVSLALGWSVDQKDVRTVWEKHRVELTAASVGKAA